MNIFRNLFNRIFYIFYHEKLFYLKEHNPEYWDLFINADTSDPHYHAKVKKVDRYYKKMTNS